MFQSPELTSNVLDNDNKLTFSLKNIHYSTANALRRRHTSAYRPACTRRTEKNDKYKKNKIWYDCQ